MASSSTTATTTTTTTTTATPSPGVSVLLLLLLLGCVGTARADLALTYVLHHHGVLGQGLNKSDPVLLYEGAQQMSGAGRDFRSRYINRQTCDKTCLGDAPSDSYGFMGSQNVGFHSGNTLARSSATDQSISSAYSFLAGIFPSTDKVPALFPPVYMNSEMNDFFTLAYTKCPKYDDRLRAWYESDEFASMEKASEAFRTRIKSLMPSMDCNLSAWWDTYNTWQMNVESMPTLTEQDKKEIAELAHWVEVRKSRSDLAGSMLGGGIVLDLLQRLQYRVQGTKSDKPQMELVSVSSDHTTILGTLMALALDADKDAVEAMESHEKGQAHHKPCNWLATGKLTGESPKVPGYGAVVVFELHRQVQSAASETAELPSAPKYAVRLVVQDGPGTEYITIPLPCKSAEADAIIGATGGCTYMPFIHYILNAANGGMPVSWCKACNNTDVDVCVKWAQGQALQGTSEVMLRQSTQISHMTATIQDQTAVIVDLEGQLESTKALRIVCIVLLSLIAAGVVLYCGWVLVVVVWRRLNAKNGTSWAKFDGPKSSGLGAAGAQRGSSSGGVGVGGNVSHGAALSIIPTVKKLNETPANSPRPGDDLVQAEAEVIGASSVFVQVSSRNPRVSRGYDGPTRVSRGGGEGPNSHPVRRDASRGGDAGPTAPSRLSRGGIDSSML